MPGSGTRAALARLDAALARLNAAVEVAVSRVGEVGALREDTARFERDRTDLAVRLDAAEARAERLAEANREVAERLIRLMDEIRRHGVDLTDGSAPAPAPDSSPHEAATPDGTPAPGRPPRRLRTDEPS